MTVLGAPPTVERRERLDALASFEVLDTPAEQAFDDLAHLAAELCDTPVALVSFVDRDRQWFKARLNFPSCETDLQSSVCKYALAEPDLLVIPDLSADERTIDNPLVSGEPHIRFYAGVPLKTPDGEVLGSLCAIDTVPRPAGLTPRQADNLQRLARQVVEQLEARRLAAEKNAALEEKVKTTAAFAASQARWRELFEQLREGIIVAEAVRDASGTIQDWRYLQVNSAWGELVGIDGQAVIGRTIRDVFPEIEEDWIDLASVVDDGEARLFTRQVGLSGRWYEGRANRISDDVFTVMFLEVTDRIRAAAAAAENTTRRLALSELADCLRTTLSIGAMSHVAGSITGRTLKAARAGFAAVDARAETVEIMADWSAPGVEGIAGSYGFRDYGSLLKT